MATSRSVPEFVGRLRKMPRAIERGAEQAVGDVAQVVTTEIRTQIEQASGGDSRLSRVGRRAKGAKVGARYNVRKAGGRSTALVGATGPLHLIERDTKAHEIQARRAGGRLRIGDDIVSGPVRHPGTRGKHPFERGVKNAQPKVGPTLQRAHRRGFTEAMR